jgi:hypothetical protein
MLKNYRLLFALFVLLIVILACANPLGGVAPAQPNVETVVAATFQALTAAAPEPLTATLPAEPSSLLPQSLYFLNNDSAGLPQVYRLEKDGKTMTQITFEPAKVDTYDVSLADGSVAYVSNNQMFMVDASGANRRKLLEGGTIDENNPFLTNLTNPVWSPNGQTIAYGYKGLNFYSVATGQSNRVLDNLIKELDGGFSIPEELYWPEKYSADGSKLVITLGYYEGASAAIYYPNGNALVRLNGDEGALICCGDTEWTADGSAFYSANASIGMFNPGLWRVDSASGATTTRLKGDQGNGTFIFARSPHLAPDGLLVSMQNGINPPLLQEKVGADRTVGMAIRMGCRKVGPGHVQTDIRGHLYLGHLHGKTTPRLEELQKTLDAVMETEISDNILGVLWSKLTYTCLGYYGSLADASLATTCTTEADRRAMADFFAEVVAVGEALGVRWIKLAEYYPGDFHPRNSADRRLAAINNFAKTWKPEDRKGPLRYVQKKIRTEVDFTLAYVVKE